MDDYKPLTPERITAAAKGADCTLLLKDYSFSMPAFARAIERAAIENYLAQREPADAWLLTLRSLLNDLIAHAQANGLEIARAGDVLESTAQVGFRLAGILEHAKRFVSTPPAPQDAQTGKDAERWRSMTKTYWHEPLFNRATGEEVKDEVNWIIHWRGPKAALLPDAIDAAIARATGEQK